MYNMFMKLPNKGQFFLAQHRCIPCHSRANEIARQDTHRVNALRTI